MKVIIQTQSYENYGAHDWDHKGECPQHWKPKGGDTFIFTCTPRDKDKLSELVEVSNSMFQDRIINFVVVEEAQFNVRDYVEEWERPIFVEKGESCWLVTRISSSEFDDFDYTRETWIMGVAQSSEAMNREVCIGGELFTYSEWIAQQHAARSGDYEQRGFRA